MFTRRFDYAQSWQENLDLIAMKCVIFTHVLPRPKVRSHDKNAQGFDTDYTDPQASIRQL